MSTPERQALRGVGCGRMLVGVLSLAGVRAGTPLFADLSPRASVAARVLAVRDLAQGAALVLAPESRSADVARMCTVVDGLHALSMLPFVALSPRYRAAATLSAASALTWVALTSVASRS
jgi:hypothetical protein